MEKNGIIFVYDITNKQSFKGVKNWIKDSESNGKFEAIICGNKSDLEENREVKIEELKGSEEEMKMEVLETNAKNGTNIKEAFEKLVDLILKSKSDEELIKNFGENQSQNLNLTKSKKKKVETYLLQ